MGTPTWAVSKKIGKNFIDGNLDYWECSTVLKGNEFVEI
jgi:hypothetical protein